MKIRKVRLDPEGRFVDQTDLPELQGPQQIKELLDKEGVSMVTLTFDDGRETLWSLFSDERVIAWKG